MKEYHHIDTSRPQAGLYDSLMYRCAMAKVLHVANNHRSCAGWTNGSVWTLPHDKAKGGVPAPNGFRRGHRLRLRGSVITCHTVERCFIEVIGSGVVSRWDSDLLGAAMDQHSLSNPSGCEWVEREMYMSSCR